MSGLFDVKALLDDVDKEEREALFKEAKKLIIKKRKEIHAAKKIVKQLQTEEKDILSRIEQGI